MADEIEETGLQMEDGTIRVTIERPDGSTATLSGTDPFELAGQVNMTLLEDAAEAIAYAEAVLAEDPDNWPTQVTVANLPGDKEVSITGEGATAIVETIIGELTGVDEGDWDDDDEDDVVGVIYLRADGTVASEIFDDSDHTDATLEDILRSGWGGPVSGE